MPKGDVPEGDVPEGDVPEGDVPSIILDINEAVTEKQLRSLLSFCKVIGDEANLARCFVIMSASVHTFGINLMLYRCVHVPVVEATDSVIKEYCIYECSSHCSEFSYNLSTCNENNRLINKF